MIDVYQVGDIIITLFATYVLSRGLFLNSKDERLQYEKGKRAESRNKQAK